MYKKMIQSPQYTFFMKIRSSILELLHADRQTDGRTDVPKLISVLLQLLGPNKRGNEFPS
jgi:hypothetical protein